MLRRHQRPSLLNGEMVDLPAVGRPARRIKHFQGESAGFHYPGGENKPANFKIIERSERLVLQDNGTIGVFNDNSAATFGVGLRVEK